MLTEDKSLWKLIKQVSNLTNSTFYFLLVLLPKLLPDGTVDPTESMGWRENNKYYEEWTLEDMMYYGRKKL